jgi:tetratricopeptide (TPR) repeat protein
MRTSNIRRFSKLHLILLSTLIVGRPILAQTRVIAGVVQDAQGNPIEHAQIKLVCERAPEKSLMIISDDHGAYRFEDVDSGKCQLFAERAGYGTAVSTVLIPPATATSVVTNLTLRALSKEDDRETSLARPNFEAAGVRGLIDPGGYSASANAAAATSVISGIADIKRANNGIYTSPPSGLPCSLESELTKAVSANPQSAEANRRLGEFYLSHGSASKAIPYLDRAHQLDSLDSWTVLTLSQALLANGQFDSARELLLKLIPNQAGAAFNQMLASADEGTGHFDQAAKQYRIAAEKEPAADNTFGVGYELILDGHPADALEAFRDGMVRYPSSSTLVIGAGTAELLEGQSSVALNLFLQAADLDTADPRPYPFLAEAYSISGGQRERVHASLERHLRISTTDAAAYYSYSLILLHESEHVAANDALIESMLQQAIALNPNFAEAHFQLGVHHARHDDYKDAAQEFEAALGIAPNMNEAHYRLALAYKKLGRPEAAEREMKLFRHARESSTSIGADREVSIEKFLSVMSPKSQPSVAKEIQCQGDATPP